jgi:hypothetical protein
MAPTHASGYNRTYRVRPSPSGRAFRTVVLRSLFAAKVPTELKTTPPELNSTR